MTPLATPCALCGTEGGWVDKGRHQRFRARPYGLDGSLCRGCWRLLRSETDDHDPEPAEGSFDRRIALASALVHLRRGDSAFSTRAAIAEGGAP